MRSKVTGPLPFAGGAQYGPSKWYLSCGHIGFASSRWVRGELRDPKTINCKECDERIKAYGATFGEKP